MQAFRITAKHYTTIFLVAMVTIAIQILVCRISSVTLYYHFAFGGITLAMLGLTAGSLKVHRDPEYFGAERCDMVLAEYGSRCAMAIASVPVLHIWLAGVLALLRNGVAIIDGLPTICLLASMFALLYVFVDSGVCIALLLTRFPAQSGRLYAFDLCGAALGCILIIAALYVFDPVSLLLVLSAALACTAWRLLPPTAERSLKRRVKLVALLLTILSMFQTATYWNGTPAIRLTWAKGQEFMTPPTFEHWNTYSRIAVSDYDNVHPFGWGFGFEQNELIEQKFLTIDANAATILTRFDGDLNKVSYLQNDIVNLSYLIRKVESVAVIGAGGGRDILSALVVGAKRIQGIEINPAIVSALTKKYGNFCGHLELRPEVSIVTAEARSYLTSHSDRYDLIQISLIDTWAATAAGGLTLSENNLYTVNAWNDFLDRLTDPGILTVSRWYEPSSHKGEFYRMLAIASKVIKTRDPKATPRQHLLAATVNRNDGENSIVTLIVSKSPLTREDIEHFHTACRTQKYVSLLTPDEAVDEIASRLASGTADASFFKSLPMDFNPSTDDKPFFFHMRRFGDFLSSRVTPPANGANANYHNNAAVFVLFFIFVITLAASVTLIIWPMAKLFQTHRIKLAEVLPYMVYFASIGLGFMLIEIAQMQRLMIFLGHPVYGLGVVLFTLLLSSAIGSYVQRNVDANQSGLWHHPVLLCAVLLVLGMITPTVTEHAKYYNTFLRVVISGMLIACMGFFMGKMFPLGIALARIHHQHLLAWFWGINGGASVFASVLAVVLSLQCGISATFWTGVACYGACLLTVVFLLKRTPV